MSRSILSFLLLIFFCQIGISQEGTTPNIQELKKLGEVIKAEAAERNERIKEYLLTHPEYTDGIFMMNGKESVITDIVDGRPRFITVYNRGAAATTNANELHDGGASGLSLDGDGVSLAVWDGGKVLTSHQEFGGRATNMSTNDISGHATHVTGTVIASGVNSSAKGMAPSALVRNYDFGNGHESEMVAEAAAGLILSNHSYGPPAGWDDTGEFWWGNENISTEEDYTYGFYDNRCRQWDQIAYNAPGYTMVKSSGNHRGNNGAGHPANGPYDCIAGPSNAKNMITVGAVRKIQNYNQPSDVIMSSFSSWGPTDDGRIKPDIVGAGVGVLSTGSGSDTDYFTSQGTSMSSPNVMGSLALVQQAHNELVGGFMRAATLKALMIHTAEECGPDPGPDYMFGWGLLNVRKMVDIITSLDGVNEVIVEEQISNGGTFDIELNPVPGEKITATMVWTDVPGSASSASLDPPNIKLVNDLDLAVVDENGDKQFPWILNPSSPEDGATKGDNIRDNVEKVEFDNPEPRKYFLRVSHKGNLTNGLQRFSVILSYKSEISGLTNLYWIGKNGDWSNASNWSLTSGGVSANITPTSENKVLFDDNSFNGNGEISQMDGDFEVGAISWFSNHNSTIDLGGQSLTVAGNVLMDSEALTLQNGRLILSSDNTDRVFAANMIGLSSNNLDLEFGTNNMAEWSFDDSDIALNSLSINGGIVEFNNAQMSINSFMINPSSSLSLNMHDVIINDVSSVQASGNVTYTDRENVFNFINSGPTSLSAENISFNSTFNFNGSDAVINGEGSHFGSVTSVGGTVDFENTTSVGSLILDGVTNTEVSDGITLTVTEDMQINNGGMEANIDNGEGVGNGTMFFDVHKKLCFDNIRVINVDIQGNSSVNAGQNSTVTNSINWFEVACEDLLFADFYVENFCAFDYTLVIDNSSGDVASRKWFVEDDFIVEDVDIMGYNFMGEGSFSVRLEIESSTGESLSHTKDIVLVPNSLEPNTIIENSTQLVSKELSDVYQWYRNDTKLEGETGRIHTHNDVPGNYFVLTFDDECSRQSEVLSFNVAVDEVFLDGTLSIYPNPVNEFINVEFTDIDTKGINIELYDLIGHLYYSKELEGNSQSSLTIKTQDLTSGLYIIKIEKGTSVFTEKLFKD